MELIWRATGESPYGALFDFLKLRDDGEPFAKPSRTAARYYLKPITPLDKILSVQANAPEGGQQSIWMDEAGMLQAENWNGPVDEHSKFASVSAAGENLRSVQRLCLEAAQSIELRGLVNGQPRSTTLTLPFKFDESL